MPTRGKNNINSDYNELFLNWSPGQVKPKTIILVFVASKKITLLRIKTKSKDWLAQNEYNVSEWSIVSSHRLLLQ